jgi:hypothetical protein
MQYVVYALDKSTIVRVDEKIMIIEFDDYWNFNDAMYHYGIY